MRFPCGASVLMLNFVACICIGYLVKQAMDLNVLCWRYVLRGYNVGSTCKAVRLRLSITQNSSFNMGSRTGWLSHDRDGVYPAHLVAMTSSSVPYCMDFTLPSLESFV